MTTNICPQCGSDPCDGAEWDTWECGSDVPNFGVTQGMFRQSDTCTARERDNLRDALKRVNHEADIAMKRLDDLHMELVTTVEKATRSAPVGWDTALALIERVAKERLRSNMSVELAEDIAKRWMPGTRLKSSRPAWAHPEDVVKLVRECPFLTGDDEEHALQVAWLHDVLEDGKQEDGSPVIYTDLTKAGVNGSVASDVDYLSKVDAQPRWHYYTRLVHGATSIGIAVKVMDRVVNLKEGSETLGRRWFFNYRRDARLDIKPLLIYIGEPLLRKWLEEKLEEAMKPPWK